MASLAMSGRPANPRAASRRQLRWGPAPNAPTTGALHSENAWHAATDLVDAPTRAAVMEARSREARRHSGPAHVPGDEPHGNSVAPGPQSTHLNIAATIPLVATVAACATYTCYALNNAHELSDAPAQTYRVPAITTSNFPPISRPAGPSPVGRSICLTISASRHCDGRQVQKMRRNSLNCRQEF
jgi:hypothetical protein